MDRKCACGRSFKRSTYYRHRKSCSYFLGIEKQHGFQRACICGLISNSQTSFYRHRKKCSLAKERKIKNPVKICRCGKKFTTSSWFYQHKKICSKWQGLNCLKKTCGLCDKIFMRFYMYQKHKTKCVNRCGNDFICEEEGCFYKVNSDEKFIQHLKNNHAYFLKRKKKKKSVFLDNYIFDSGVGMRPPERVPPAKKAIRRREPRRHTVSNGIDYNMIKRLKLLEQEKDFLSQGLDVVERARNWYLQQIANVNDKLDQVSKCDIPHSEYSMDAQQERLNFQMTRISEVNQHLTALMETSEKGFPIHMNLAVHQRNIYGQQKTANQTIQRLKNQNHALTEEIAKKSEMITQLESEKSSLIRELFHARTYTGKEANDTTLW